MGGAVPHHINFFIDRCFFIDVSVALGYVGFRLVVIIVADEVLHGVVGKQFFKFFVELCSQCFIMGYHQGWFLYFVDYIGHGEGFTRTRNS